MYTVCLYVLDSHNILLVFVHKMSNLWDDTLVQNVKCAAKCMCVVMLTVSVFVYSLILTMRVCMHQLIG